MTRDPRASRPAGACRSCLNQVSSRRGLSARATWRLQAAGSALARDQRGATRVPDAVVSGAAAGRPAAVVVNANGARPGAFDEHRFFVTASYSGDLALPPRRPARNRHRAECRPSRCWSPHRDSGRANAICRLVGHRVRADRFETARVRIVSDVLRDVPGVAVSRTGAGRAVHPGAHPRGRGQPHAHADRRHQGKRPVLRRVRLRHPARRRRRQGRSAARRAERALWLRRHRRRDPLHHADGRGSTRHSRPRRRRLVRHARRRAARRPASAGALDYAINGAYYATRRNAATTPSAHASSAPTTARRQRQIHLYASRTISALKARGALQRHRVRTQTNRISISRPGRPMAFEVDGNGTLQDTRVYGLARRRVRRAATGAGRTRCPIQGVDARTQRLWRQFLHAG